MMKRDCSAAGRLGGSAKASREASPATAGLLDRAKRDGPLCPLERLRRAVVRERFEQIVYGADLERADRELVECRDEDDDRHVIDARFACTTENPSISGICTSRNTTSGASDESRRSRRVLGALCDNVDARFGLEQRRQAVKRDGLVVDDNYAHGTSERGECGVGGDRQRYPRDCAAGRAGE